MQQKKQRLIIKLQPTFVCSKTTRSNNANATEKNGNKVIMPVNNPTNISGNIKSNYANRYNSAETVLNY